MVDKKRVLNAGTQGPGPIDDSLLTGDSFLTAVQTGKKHGKGSKCVRTAARFFAKGEVCRSLRLTHPLGVGRLSGFRFTGETIMVSDEPFFWGTERQSKEKQRTKFGSELDPWCVSGIGRKGRDCGGELRKVLATETGEDFWQSIVREWG